MRKFLPVAVLLVVALVAGFLVLDPLGLLAGGTREATTTSEQEEAAAGAQLAGRGREKEEIAGATTIDGEPVGVLDLALGKASLAGTVVGEGRPLAGARVRAVVPPPAPEGGVRTRADGTWEIRGLPAGRFEVRGSADGWRARTVLAPEVADGGSATVQPIVLGRVLPFTDGFEVRVTDAFGRPLANAKVLATTIMWGLHLAMGPEVAGVPGVVSKAALTDERGVAELSALPPNRYDVVAFREGYVTTGQSNVQAAAGRTVKLTFRLAEGLSIRGVMVDAQGNPVSGGFVTGLLQPTFASTLTVTTGADGTFTLDGLREGNYMLVGGHEEHGELVLNPVKAPSTGVRMKLGGTGRLELEVVTPDGKPVTSYKFRPYVEEPFGYVYSQVHDVNDPAGRTTIPLGPHSWNLSVTTADGSNVDVAGVKVEVGQTQKARAVVPATGVVRGVVVDAEGEHVTGAEVYVRRGGFPPMPSREHYAKSDDEGAFVVKGLPVGKDVKLHVRHERYAGLSLDAVPAPADDAAEVTVRLTAGARIEGRVLDAEGRPVPGQLATVMQGMNFYDLRTSTTDDDGAFAFDALSPGKYTVSVGTVESMGRGQSQSVDVAGGGVARADFQAKAAGTKTVTGTVRRSGGPVADTSIMAIDQRGFDHAVAVTTDGQGAFEASGLLPGRVRVRAETSDGASKTVNVDVPAEGEASPVTIEFGGASVAARVVNREGGPVSGAWVSVEAAGEEGDWTRVVAQKTTLGDGTFRAEALSGGTYQVRVVHQGRAPLLTAPFTLGDAEGKDLGTLTLAEGFTISGTVHDDAGRPVEDATVSTTDSAGRPVLLFSFATTGSDGRYRVQELQPGTYTLKVEARGYAPFTRSVTIQEGPLSADAVLIRGGEVRVTVEDQAGQPIQGARVTLVDSRGQTVTKTLSLVSLLDGNLGLTTDKGVALVPDLAAGAYRVRARKDGFQVLGDEPQALVPGGGMVQVRLTMRPAP